MKAPLLVEQKKGGCRHKEDKTDQSQVVLRSCAERGLFWREKKLVCGRPCSLHNVPNLQDFRGSSDFRHFVFGVLNNARGTTVSGEQKKEFTNSQVCVVDRAPSTMFPICGISGVHLTL